MEHSPAIDTVVVKNGAGFLVIPTSAGSHYYRNIESMCLPRAIRSPSTAPHPVPGRPVRLQQGVEKRRQPITTMMPSPELVHTMRLNRLNELTCLPLRQNLYVDEPCRSATTFETNEILATRTTFSQNSNHDSIDNDHQVTNVWLPMLTASDGLKKESSKELSVIEAPSRTAETTMSLACPRCHRCRCARCSELQELPTCCAGRYTARKVVDCVSCTCCVQAVIYHCSTTEDSGGHPCDDDGICKSCRPSGNCCARWTFLAAAVPFLPCLLLYWPLRGAVTAITACYNCDRHASRKCRCKSTDSSSNSEKNSTTST